MHIKFVLCMGMLCAVSMNGVHASDFDYGLHHCKGPYVGQHAVRIALLCAAVISATYGVAKLAQWIFPSAREQLLADAQTVLCMACNLYGPAAELASSLMQNDQLTSGDEAILYKLAAVLPVGKPFDVYYGELQRSVDRLSELEYALFAYYPQKTISKRVGNLCVQVMEYTCKMRALEFFMSTYFSYFACFACEAELLRRYEDELALVIRFDGKSDQLCRHLDQMLVLRAISMQETDGYHLYAKQLSSDCERLAHCISDCRGLYPHRAGAAHEMLDRLLTIYQSVSTSWHI